MIIYFDSSSIVKWFFDEPFEDLARNAKNRASIAITSLIAFPEVMSAFNRAWRDRRCRKKEMEIVCHEFERIWPDFKWITVNERLLQQAGRLIFKHNLKGFDAVHLASALELKAVSDGIDLFFSSFDRQLNYAARKEGFLIHEKYQNKERSINRE